MDHFDFLNKNQTKEQNNMIFHCIFSAKKKQFYQRKKNGGLNWISKSN